MSQDAVKILLVEDNSADAALMRAVLKGSTYGLFSLTHVKRLDEAVRQLASDRFDVVLLDLGLPDSQGLQTLNRLQKQSRQMPVVVMTGLDDEALAVRALQAGAQDYLVKSDAGGTMVARAIRYSIERKRAEEAFLASEQRLALAVDAVQAGIWDWDLQTGQIAWLHHHAPLFGLASDQFDGSYEMFLQRVHADDRAAVHEVIEHSRLSRAPYHQEFRVVWPDSTVHWIESRGRVFHDDRGEPVRIMGTVVDITQRKDAEEAARLREAELAHLSRVNTMGQMASGLAHELNQPMSAILNYASICQEQLASGKIMPDKMMLAIQELMNETRRAGAIISRLRSFVRKQRPKSSAVDINQLIEEAVRILEFELRHQGIRPRMRLADDLPSVLADIIQIEQVLVNLIFNALEAMNDPGSSNKQLILDTVLLQDDPMVEVSVTDTGSGVSTEAMERLFEPFFTTKPQGLGMGLNISRTIIESHGGRLTAARNPQSGMRFSFTLPLADGAPS